MLKRLIFGTVMLCTLLLVITPVTAKVLDPTFNEPWSRAGLTQQVGQLNTIITATTHPQLKLFLESVRNKADLVLASSVITSDTGQKTQKSLSYALKLATDVNHANQALWNGTPFIVYDTPALSPHPRLPDSLPEDGKVSNQLSIISAKGEFEPASFVLSPLSNVSSATFVINELTREGGGTIPSSAVDLRVVKNWYQGGTAWYSYFADDSQNVLVPELLLHDENLVLVDHERKGNSLRVDYPTGSQYVDISNIPATPFDVYKTPVEDSPTLLPIALKQGESKQIWLTLKVPKETPAGFYKGTIDITADGASAGQITLNVRVLPFELPNPKTYYDTDKDFYVMLYHHARLKETLAAAKGDTALVEANLLNQYRNLADHNVLNLPGPEYSTKDKTVFLRQLELMQQAGLDLDPLFGVKPTFDFLIYEKYTAYMNAKKAYDANPTAANKQKMDTTFTAWRTGADKFKLDLDEAFNVASGFVGHTNLFFDGWDEAWKEMLLFQQENWKYIHDKGAKVFATGNAGHLELEEKEDFLNWVGEPTRDKANQWHSAGENRMITNYAFPHTGPENPDLMRQRHGMWLYKANYDATYNYNFLENPVNPWNDNSSAGFPYRAFNLVYPTRTNLIDTIAWEGFREGIDDIRYATKLKQVAADAIASGKSVRIAAANKALTWLESSDERSTNADLLRLEMIRYIVRLLDLENTQ
ncbi:hypothetical protein [Cohnella abietis]|uniref:Glycoside hydrolase 123 C-terminal domain-containing protein n=1 Tax=Cohnella abietis TaxID=2507935 RepID=A0A3T1CXS3_9BACL|nr:hypothetical protein [Cohnella abietis]BBI30611.1 hypothetical protein KCTCHS21_00100 [Cohnella abietis]